MNTVAIVAAFEHYFRLLAEQEWPHVRKCWNVEVHLTNQGRESCFPAIARMKAVAFIFALKSPTP